MVSADMTGDSTSNPFWEYSLSAYGRTEVAESCLALQDDFGIDVNFLLYASWLASRGHALTDAHLAALEETAACWRKDVVKPLRALRRQLPIEGPGGAVRDEIKAIELGAERRQQELMYRCFGKAQLETSTGPLLWDNLCRVAGLFAEDVGRCEPLLRRLGDLLET